MNKLVKRVWGWFYPMENGIDANSANQEQSIETFKFEAQPIASWDEQVKNWAVTEGYLKHDKKAAWDTIKARIESKAEPDDPEPPIEIPTTAPESESDKIGRQRLIEIKDKIQPRLESANAQARRLERMGITLNGTKLMIWFGWLCVTALGWVFSWMLERIVKAPKPPDGTTAYSINDIVALFVVSFTTLRDKVIKAYPDYVNYEWLVIVLGIVMVLSAIFAYLHAQRLSGKFQSIGTAIDIYAQGGAGSDDYLGDHKKSNKKSDKEEDLASGRKASKWLIVAVILGLLGFGILLSAIQQSYNTISMIMLGYSLAVVVVAVMMLVVHYTLRRMDSDLENQRYLPDWLFKTLIGVTLGVLAMLLISLVLLAGVTSDFPSILAVFSVGTFLLLGTAALAVGQVQHNIFKNEIYWIHVRAQIERRLQKLQHGIEKPMREAEEVKKKQDERNRKAAAEKAKLQREVEQIKTVFEEAYNRGMNTRELQEQGFSKRAELVVAT